MRGGGARELHPGRPHVRIDIAGREQHPGAAGQARRAALVMTAIGDGPGGRRRVVIGPADGAELVRLGELLDGGRRAGADRRLDLVELDETNGTLVERLREEEPDDVYVLLDGPLDEHVVATIGPRLLMDGIAIHLVLPEGGGPPVRMVAACVGDRACVSLHAVSDDGPTRVLGRALDVAGAAFLLVLLAPLFALMAALVWWRMGWPVIYAQERVGRRARRFSLYKFRSMVADAEDVLRASPETYRRYVAANYKLPEAEDPRITPLGRFLRRTSLDELPQLWNVLRGDMGLVGPRPVVPAELAEYGDYGRMLLRAKPGLTGAWQVGGRSAIGYPERARLELRYVAARSLAADMLILLRTVPAVLRRRGAL